MFHILYNEENSYGGEKCYQLWGNRMKQVKL